MTPGWKLPAGFCATVFADGIGHARDMAVASNGVVYVNTWSGRYYGNDKPHDGGFLVALQDTAGKGVADVKERFGETVQTGGAGGTGIGIYKDAVYAEINDRIARYPLTPGSIVPKIPVSRLCPASLSPAITRCILFIIDSKGMMYVDVASPSNACQVQNRTPASPGKSPCPELETRGGIWLYDANKTNQTFSAAERYATGIRNGEGLTFRCSRPSVRNPARPRPAPRELAGTVQAGRGGHAARRTGDALKKGGDYGWPECYYDAFRQKLVQAPEYGGDGGKKLGVCGEKIAPIVAFPAHWAPNGMTHYSQKQFPARYHSGVFIAFHGSWDRAPYPQGGYNVVYQALAGDHAAGSCEVFADSFAGAAKSPDKAAHRPSGIAVGPDGALYVSDDMAGRIYKIVYIGGSANSGGTITPCPSAASPAG